MNLNDAIKIAKEVRKNAYVPYSNYTVGAALVTKSGKIYSGCNIENGGIMSICAERVAFTKALSEGEKDFDYIVGDWAYGKVRLKGFYEDDNKNVKSFNNIKC